MAESKIRDDNFYQISGWMLNRLGLKGTALQVYAIIYGFSQDGESSFTGSLQYLCDFTNANRSTIIRTLKDLVERGALLKTETIVNGVQFNTYKANRYVKNDTGGGEMTLGGWKNDTGGSGKMTPPPGGKMTPNNKALDNISDNKEDRAKYQRIADMYNETCVSFPRLRSLSDARKRAIKARLNTYTEEQFRTIFEKAEASDFMKGRNRQNWMATFDWMIKDANMAKILDGNYDNKGGMKHGGPGEDPGKTVFGNVI